MKTAPNTELRQFKSSFDGTPQPFLLQAGEPGRPLVVHLHSWSARFNDSGGLEQLVHTCAAQGWSLCSPDFRGANDHPEACASPAALQDVLDAVKASKKELSDLEGSVFLSGGSGGGHMGLCLSHFAPKSFSAVQVWNPIVDLPAWHRLHQTRPTAYASMLEQCCGGPPGADPDVNTQYELRSPIHFLEQARGLPIQINLGIQDGHQGSVTIDHGLRAFDILARSNGHPERQLGNRMIDFLTGEAALPEDLISDPIEQGMRKHEILFRRQAGPVELLLFEGAHDSDLAGGIPWFKTHL